MIVRKTKNKNKKKNSQIKIFISFLAIISTLYLGFFNIGTTNIETNVNLKIGPEIEATNEAPHSSFRISKTTLKTGENVNFYARTSYDIDGTIENYEWDFGDGQTAFGTEVNHQYDMLGIYEATLTVIDDGGLSDSSTQNIYVALSGDQSSIDNSQLSFENDTEGFAYNTYNAPAANSVDVSIDTTNPYSGMSSLKIDATIAEAATVEISIDSPTALVDPGSEVFFNIWVPSGFDITEVQLFVMPHTSDWSDSQWLSAWNGYEYMLLDQWLQTSIQIPLDIDPSWYQSIGIQIKVQSPATFTFYMDSISWYAPSMPNAAFDYNEMRPNPGDTVNFDATGSSDTYLISSDPDGNIESYEWDFGDGQTASGEQQTHSYDSIGKYPVTLLVTDNDGYVHQMSRVVWVGIVDRTFSPPLTVEGSTLVDADGNVVVNHGCALVDDLTYTEEDFDYLKNEWKFDSIRLALIIERWYYVSAEEQETYLGAYDRYLQWTYDRGMYVSMDPWHESGVGVGEIQLFDDIKDAFNIAAARFAQWPHMTWEIVNEPHAADWNTWAPMAEELIDIVRSYEPVSDVCMVPGVNWAQTFDVRNRPIDRPNVGYSVHPYPHVYLTDTSGLGAWSNENWDDGFGYIVNEGYGPIMNTEWSYPLFDYGDRSYGEQMLTYMEEHDIGWLGWIYGSWGNFNRDLNNRDDCTQLWWEFLNGLWSPDIEILEYEIGDVNHDGSVSVVDSLLVSQYYVGIEVEIDLSLADVNLDGMVTIIDALLISQYYVGIIPSLPA